MRARPILHRDDPQKDPLVGHTKVTAEDWLNVARDMLVHDGVAEVKVLALGARLGVSRSSFYWYFKSRKHLLEALLDDWEKRNTQTVVAQCAHPSADICENICHFFRCFIDPALFDPGLDFAVREWARRAPEVRARIDHADQLRMTAVKDMYLRHGYSDYDADVRAQILYYMQLGYHALEVREAMTVRTERLEGLLRGFTGVEPDAKLVTRIKAQSLQFSGAQIS